MEKSFALFQIKEKNASILSLLKKSSYVDLITTKPEKDLTNLKRKLFVNSVKTIKDLPEELNS
jgi:hypothetical protein